MPDFPQIASAGVKQVFCDTETTGLEIGDTPVGISYALDDGQKGYFRWGHPGGNNCNREDAVRWWNEEIAPSGLVVFHNAVFDCRQMAAVGGKIPVKIEDTCVIAALLNEYEPSFKLNDLCKLYLGEQHVKDSDRLNQYCRDAFKASVGNEGAYYHKCHGDLVEPYATQDAVLVRLLWLCLRSRIDKEDLAKVHNLESRIIPVLVRMYRAGVRVDVEKAELLKAELLLERERTMGELQKMNGGRELNVESTAQKAAFLEKFGITVPRTAIVEKIKKKTGEKYLSGGNPSVTKEILEEIDHPSAQLIMTAMKTQHYASTFIDNYIFNNITDRQHIHPSFHQARSQFGGARTGRFSSAGGLNAQNIPKRDKVWAPRVRGLFIPSYDGGQWLRSDYSQIEYRFFAHYAGGEVMRRYNENPLMDFHDLVAELCDMDRGPAKNINFGILFGMGLAKLARSTGLPPDEANEVLRRYDEMIPEAKLLSRRAMNRGSERGYIITWGGRKCRFPRHRGQFIYTHKALNYLTQGSAADLIKEAMIEVDRVIDWEDEIMHLTVHDELDFTVPPDGDGVRSGWKIKEAMESVVQLRVPVKAVAEIGTSWGECGDLPELVSA